MKANVNVNIKKLAAAGMMTALGVCLSAFSIPVGASRCFPIQHLLTVLAGIFLGPAYGVGFAFSTALIRNLLGTGSLLAFPGSMCGALLCGLAWRTSKNLWLTLAAEVFGTGIIGGLLSWPVAVAFMGVNAGTVAFTAYVAPFLVSTAGGSVLAGALVFALQKSGALGAMRGALEH